jgi:hypothetical protein
MPVAGNLAGWQTARMTDGFVAPSSETSVKLVELTGFIADLYHAEDALRRVIEIDEGEATDDMLLRSHFVTAAVVSYWRCFTSSSRRTLDDYVSVPGELIELHEELRVYRNRTVAQADSGLVGTHVLSVDPAASGTIYVTMPAERVTQMGKLVDALLRTCESLAADLHVTLSRHLRDQHVDWEQSAGWDPRDPRS